MGRRTRNSCLLDSRLLRIPTWRSRSMSEWIARPRRVICDLSDRLRIVHSLLRSMLKWIARPRRVMCDLCGRLRNVHLTLQWVARPRRVMCDLSDRLRIAHLMLQWVARPRRVMCDLSDRLRIAHCSCRLRHSGSCYPRNLGGVLRVGATDSLSLGSRLRSAATRNLGKPDDLSSLTLGVGHRSRKLLVQ